MFKPNTLAPAAQIPHLKLLSCQSWSYGRLSEGKAADKTVHKAYLFKTLEMGDIDLKLYCDIGWDFFGYNINDDNKVVLFNTVQSCELLKQIDPKS